MAQAQKGEERASVLGVGVMGVGLEAGRRRSLQGAPAHCLVLGSALLLAELTPAWRMRTTSLHQ